MISPQFSLEPFAQADWLDGDRKELGFCVSLCDHWLHLIRSHYGDSPKQRLTKLKNLVPQAKAGQRMYGVLRSQLGREEARRIVGNRLGLNYDDQTTIGIGAGGWVGIKNKIKADIGAPHKAATWSMRFGVGGGGHAIAGFCGVTRLPFGLEYRMHLFDPNIGEYGGGLVDIDAILDDLLIKIPWYRTVSEVHRSWEG